MPSQYPISYNTYQREIAPRFISPTEARDAEPMDGEFIHESLTRAIDHYKLSSFNAFGIDVLVYPTKRNIEIRNGKGQGLGFRRYFFRVHGENPKAMHVRVDSAGSVRIHLHGQWSPVSAFLQHFELPPHHDPKEGVVNAKMVRWGEQSDWWNANGKHFRLLALPAELREIIYGFVIGAQIEPYNKSPPTPRVYLSRHSKPMKMVIELMCTCRLVHREASNILYVHTPFSISHALTAEKLLQYPRQCSSIRRVDLALSHGDYIRLFRGKHQDGASRSLLTLRSLQLTRLTLTFRPPMAIADSTIFDKACQKTAVEWIIAAAWPLIRGHPVKLLGYIKTAQKLELEAAFRQENKEYRKWKAWTVAATETEGNLVKYDVECHRMNGRLEDDGGYNGEGGIVLDGGDTEWFDPAAVIMGDHARVCKCKVPCQGGAWDADA